MTHFKLFYYFLLIWCEKRVAVCCFAYDYTICWKDYLFPLKWLLTLLKSNWPYTLSLFLGLLFYPSHLCVFIPELYYLDYCGSITILETRESKYSDCGLFQSCFSHASSSAVPIILEPARQIPQISMLRFDLDCSDFVNHFVKNCHLNATESSDSRAW